MNRSQDWNYSEYAITTMGMMPKNYIIVNESEVHYNTETALRVGHNRIAIPVKEFARQRRLSLKEQWELMNPQWIGTYFNCGGSDPYKNRRPTLEQAMDQAMQQDRFDEFMQQFWSAEYGHKKAIERLSHRAADLESRGREYDREISRLDRQIVKVTSDINKGQLTAFHLQGYNAHEHLQQLKDQRLELNEKRWECFHKAQRIKEYINSITY